MSDLVLSLFPGIGLLDRAFEAEGFCVVRGPDLLWGGDVKRFHPPPKRFEGVIGGPPCQAHSSLANLNRAIGNKVAADLIPEFARCVNEAQPDWWLMENVPRAPDPVTPGYAQHRQPFNNRWAGGVQNRLRHVWFGTRVGRPLLPRVPVFEAAQRHETVLASSGGEGGKRPIRKGYRVSNVTASATVWDQDAQRPRGIKSEAYFRVACKLQGLPDDFDLPGFKVGEKIRAVGNGVPYPLARCLAQAVREALE